MRRTDYVGIRLWGFSVGLFDWFYLIGSNREQVPEESELDNPFYEPAPGEDDE